MSFYLVKWHPWLAEGAKLRRPCGLLGEQLGDVLEVEMWLKHAPI